MTRVGERLNNKQRVRNLASQKKRGEISHIILLELLNSFLIIFVDVDLKMIEARLASILKMYSASHRVCPVYLGARTDRCCCTL